MGDWLGEVQSVESKKTVGFRHLEGFADAVRRLTDPGHDDAPYDPHPKGARELTVTIWQEPSEVDPVAQEWRGSIETGEANEVAYFRYLEGFVNGVHRLGIDGDDARYPKGRDDGIRH